VSSDLKNGKLARVSARQYDFYCFDKAAFTGNTCTKKQMRIKKFIPLLLAALIFIGFLAHPFFYRERNETLLKPLQQDVQLAWPAAGQAAIGNVEDGLLARSSDNEKLRPIASMAKVITALAIMEKQPFKPGQEGQTYSITKNDIAGLNAYFSQGGSVLPIFIGMKLTQYHAMQRMLIASDNIIADILVERIFGSKEAYVTYVRDMLKRMGLSRTVVADACGFNPATVSTPSELIPIGIAALKNPVIARIVALQQARIPIAGNIKNTNQLLGTDGVIGIKTGTTDAAGSCLLFAARYTAKDGQKGTIVGVIMGDANHSRLYSDSRALLASAKRGFGLVTARSTDSVVAPSPKQRTNQPPKQ
jgi:serine-type D-Ala-D-Ala carboxypeptidase (penicillin-binding protein 5/6)